MTTHAVMYLRSNPHDGPSEPTAEDQAAACRALIEGNGWETVGTYLDNGTGDATRRPRPEFERLLADVRAGGIDTIVCFRLNRLYRHMDDINALASAGVTIKSVTES